MSDRLTAPVEWRASTERRGPGILTITALTVGERAQDRPEVFDAAPEIPEGGVLVGRLHPTDNAPIVRAPVEVRDGSVVVEVELPDTQAGRDAAVEVRNGTLSKASIEFWAIRDRIVAGVRHVMRSALVGVALVPAGAYAGARAEVRGRRRRRRWG